MVSDFRQLARNLISQGDALVGVLRTAKTGLTAPPLFETMAVLGKERCLRRVDEAWRRLGG